MDEAGFVGVGVRLVWEESCDAEFQFDAEAQGGARHFCGFASISLVNAVQYRCYSGSREMNFSAKRERKSENPLCAYNK